MANDNTSILPSASRTATTNSRDILNRGAKGGHIILDVTAVSATPSIVVTIQGKDPLSGAYYTILTGAAVTTTGTTVYKIYPGITAAANASVSDVIPGVWRATVTHADTDAITYSLAANMVD